MKIMVFNPSPPAGGGGQAQAPLQDILRDCFPEADIHTLNIYSPKTGIGGHIRSFFEARKHRPAVAEVDLLLLQSPLTPSTIGLGWEAMKRDIPYVVIPHGDLVPTLRIFHLVRKPILKWILWALFAYRLLARAKAVVTNSEMDQERFRVVGGRTDNMHVIPNVLPDIATGGEPGGENGLLHEYPGLWEENRPYALFIGRVALEKGLDLVVECWPAVLERCPRALLLIAGPVDHPHILRRLIRIREKHGLGQSVVFSGWVEGHLKQRLLERARCLLLPSHNESFGIVVLEAIRARTPVIASTGTPWQSLEGSAGRCLPRDPRKWVDAIAGYLSADSKMSVDELTMNRLLAPTRFDQVVKKWRKVILPIVDEN